MRNLKKALVLVLTLAMVLSIMVVGAAAAFTDQNTIDTKHTEAVDMAVALNIINGYPDGSFKPNDNVSREEMAKMICILDNGGKEPQLATGDTFTDVAPDRWSNKYIEACAARGVVAGVGDNRFDPAGQVTATQAARMLLVELGYDQDLAGYTGSNWATNVNVDATKKGYYDDLEDIDVTAPLTREHAAQMVWNALEAKEVEYNYTLISGTDGLTSKVELKNLNKTLLADKYSAYDSDSARLDSFSYNSDKNEWTYHFDANINGSGIKNHDEFKSTQDFTDLYGQKVKPIFSEKTNGDVDKVYGLVPDESKVVATAFVGDFDNVKANDDTLKIGGVEYKLSANANRINVYNFLYGYTANPLAVSWATANFGKSVEGDILTITDDHKYFGFEIQGIDYNDNGKIDFFVMYPFQVTRVDSTNSSKFSLKDQVSGTLTFKYEDVTYYDGIAEDDFVVAIPKANSNIGEDTFIKVNDVLTGSVTSRQGDYKFQLDGTWYVATYNLSNGVAASGVARDKIESGDKVKNVAMVNGYAFTAAATGSASAEDFAVVTATSYDGYGVTVKLMFSDGSKKVVDVDTDYYTKQDTVSGKTDYEKDSGLGAGASEPASSSSADVNTFLVANLSGKLVYFDTNSDGEYQMVLATNKKVDDTNYDKALVELNPGPGNPCLPSSDMKSSGKVKYLEGQNIADDAVIFLNDAGTYKVITGSQLKNVDGKSFDYLYGYYDEDSSSGMNTVKMAYLRSFVKTGSADTKYGLLTSDIVSTKNSDGKTVYELNMWNQNGEQVTLLTKDGYKNADNSFNPTPTTAATKDLGSLKKGFIIEYGINSDGNVDKIVVHSKVDSEGNNYANMAVTGYDGTYVILNDNGKRHEISKDSVIVYIDASGPNGEASGSIRKATKNVGTGGYYNNVWACFDGGDINSTKDIDVMFVDINNDIDGAM